MPLSDLNETGCRKLQATDADERERADKVITRLSGLTRSQLKMLMEAGRVLLNGAPVRPGQIVKAWDVFTIEMPEQETGELVPENIPLEIVYSDSHLCVVNKPPGLVVYPAAGHPRGTLMNALRYRFKVLAAIGGPLRPGVVHRLDRDTSGLIVVALTDDAYYNLVEQFKAHLTERSYLALVYGRFKAKEGEIEAGIGRSRHDRKKMSTKSRSSKQALTRWKVLREYPSGSLIEARLATGRTHQIRVHMASIGHSVLGDTVYGRKTFQMVGKVRVAFPRQMLHAATLSFTHPATGERMSFSSPMPEDMVEAEKALQLK